MKFQVVEEPGSDLNEYARVSIAFEVRHVLEIGVIDGGLGGIILTEQSVDLPYIKDYDKLDGEAPTAWPSRFDISRWGILVARTNGHIAGCATVAFDTPDLRLLEGRRDVALLWDIRVLSELRRQRLGTALFVAAETWAIEHGCKYLRVETQNVNVPACRFYAGQGCELETIQRFAYPQLPEETQLLWRKTLLEDCKWQLDPREPVPTSTSQH